MTQLLQKWLEAYPHARFRTSYRTKIGKQPRWSTRKGPSIKVRRIDIPNGPMRELQACFLGYLRSFQAELPYAMAVSGNGTRVHAEQHTDSPHPFPLDLRNAYGHVDALKLAGVLAHYDRRLRDLPRTAKLLRQICMVRLDGRDFGLATGAPSSPLLFDLYAHRLIDVPISRVCEQAGLTYSRYVDDLFFSSKSHITHNVRRELRAIVMAAGFEVAHHKSGPQKDTRQQPARVTGLTVSPRGVTLPSQYRRKALAVAKQGPSGKADGHVTYITSVVGKDSDQQPAWARHVIAHARGDIHQRPVTHPRVIHKPEIQLRLFDLNA